MQFRVIVSTHHIKKNLQLQTKCLYREVFFFTLQKGLFFLKNCRSFLLFLSQFVMFVIFFILVPLCYFYCTLLCLLCLFHFVIFLLFNFCFFFKFFCWSYFFMKCNTQYLLATGISCRDCKMRSIAIHKLEKQSHFLFAAVVTFAEGIIRRTCIRGFALVAPRAS